MLKLRLLVTKDCDRDCEGCCNKEYDLDALPKVDTFKGFSEILLTGGEPMLDPVQLAYIIGTARGSAHPATRLYLYTANVLDTLTTVSILGMIDGVTLTLHSEDDVSPFYRLQELIKLTPELQKKSLRLNIFKEVKTPNILPFWKARHNIEWIKDCPLPDGEVFKRCK